jgi:hypothetical protein
MRLYAERAQIFTEKKSRWLPEGFSIESKAAFKGPICGTVGKPAARRRRREESGA